MTEAPNNDGREGEDPAKKDQPKDEVPKIKKAGKLRAVAKILAVVGAIVLGGIGIAIRLITRR